MKRFLTLLTLLVPAAFSCTVVQEEEMPAESHLYKDCIPVLARASEESRVSLNIEENAGVRESRMGWEAGDRLVIVCGGKAYIYETETPGRESLFYAIDEDNALKGLTEGTRVTAWYNVSTVKPAGQGVFSIVANQTEGENTNAVTLYADYTVDAAYSGTLPLVFKPAVSVLEFRLSAPIDYVVDKVVLTPCDGAQGYTVMNKGTVNPDDGSVSPRSSSVSPLTLTLRGAKNISGGREIRFITGKVLMDKTGALMEWYRGDEKIFSKTIWKSKTVDLTSSNLHCYQPISEIKVDTVVRMSHPRMFFNEKDIPAIKALAAGRLKNYEYRWMVNRVNPLLDQPIVFPDSLAVDGSENENHEYGTRLHDAALLWIITGEQKYLDFSKRLMRRLTQYYELRNSNNLNVDWYMYSQACAACAWDWLYNDLTPAERAELGPPFFQALCGVGNMPGQRPKRKERENVSDYTSGCYGTRMLPWYIALAFYGDGIDDALCQKMFDYGYDLNRQMVNFRRETIGDAPGASTPCVVYSLGYYPVADFNFIRLVKSATGLDFSEDLQYVLRYLDYIDWVRLPGNQSYGFGDEHHTSCKLPEKDIDYSVREIAEIYGARHPEILPKASRILQEMTLSYMAASFPVVPFLQFHDLPAPEVPAESKAGALYCENMGEVFMRSGVEEGDTYCLFVTGGTVDNHKHYDNNHFTIYKRGFRAIDSGTRPEPGLHLPCYFCRTVAHNCVTVEMPGESMPIYWGYSSLKGFLAPGEELPAAMPNDGGQCQILGSELKSMKETETYVALSSDATASYNSNKVSLVERDFIWLKPDIFVVFDRVQSKKKSYAKKWLLHTEQEPQMNGSLEFSETSQGGKMICRTLWPANAVLTKIGGPGKYFWSDGRNWPLPNDLPGNIPDRDAPSFGHWRVEVSPGSSALRDYFLNIIMVGDETLSALPETEVWESNGKIHLRFFYQGNRFTLSFDEAASSGVEIEQNVQPHGTFNDFTTLEFTEQ